MIQLTMVFVFLEKQILCLQVTLMQIGLVMLTIEKAPLKDVMSVKYCVFGPLDLH